MNSTLGRIVALLAMAAVLVYTVVNYLTGRGTLGHVLIATVFIGLPMMNIIRLMIQDRDDQ